MPEGYIQWARESLNVLLGHIQVCSLDILLLFWIIGGADNLVFILNYA